MQKELNKKLIINADDIGISQAVNDAARKCYNSGVITGLSVMACGKYFREAVSMIKDMGNPGVGVHLTLTGRFSPSAEDKEKISSLLNDGVFVEDYFSFMKRYFEKKIDPAQVYTELLSQVKKVKDSGMDITHFDSHEHVHMFPSVTRVVVRLADEFSVPYVRMPKEPVSVLLKRFTIKDLLRWTGLRSFVPVAKREIGKKDIAYNNVFFGHFHSGRIDDDILCFFMDRLRPGVNEVCVHPGERTEDLLKESAWHKNAPVELDALLNGRWRDLAKEKGVQIVSHEEVKK